MKLKCIGGPCDGQSQWIEFDPRIGDHIRVMKPLKFKVSDDIPTSYEEITKVVVANYYLYMVDCLKYSHKQNDISEIWFLRSENLTTFDAIQLQFLK